MSNPYHEPTNKDIRDSIIILFATLGVIALIIVAAIQVYL